MNDRKGDEIRKLAKNPPESRRAAGASMSTLAVGVTLMKRCKSVLRTCKAAAASLCLPSGRHSGGFAAVLIAGALSLGGCSGPAKPLVYVDPAAASQGYSMVVVADVKNGAASAVPAELLDRTGKRLGQQLQERGFSVRADQAPAGTQDYLLVNPTMQRYEGGNAIGRWFGFGAGAATCTLQVELLDGQSGKKVGDVAATQTIESGGLYSIGAGNYIVDRCADSVASGIAEKLPPAKAGG